MSKTQILTPHQIDQKIQRIAWQVYEQHVHEDEITLAGIAGSGYVLAEKIANKLKEISDLKIELIQVKVNKRKPLEHPVEFVPADQDLTDKTVVLTDDVLNSGKTLIYGVNHFLQYKLKKLTTAVLVDRNHKRFPVKADVKGLSLSTSLQENVDVVFGDDGGVYLS
ncbi:MAG: phosphoribosyltransferase family protein [Schleiferiaceae bacterium]|jgi:pyrimidine operon attenuation protein/uracil phosphoribosyltransferase|nr:phosphoribosyltransferase family protein [Schleiferiaceae bacterium]